MSLFTAARRGLNALTSNDSNLANLLGEEKDTINAYTALKTSIATSSTSLTLWGCNEADDLKDITCRYDTINKEFGLCFVELEDSQSKYREKLKEIGTLTDSLAALKAKIKACKDRLEKAIKANKNAESIQAELGGLELQLKDESAIFENEKRRLLKEAMVIQYNGIMRFSVKSRVVGEFGHHLAMQIPQINIKSGHEVPDFLGRDITQHVVEDFEAEMYDSVKRTLIPVWDYIVPQLLNMNSLQISHPDAPKSKTNELLWDSTVETDSSKLGQPLVAEPLPTSTPQDAAVQPPSSGSGWTAFASTDGHNASNVSSSSSLHQLPSDFVENPW